MHWNLTLLHQFYEVEEIFHLIVTHTRERKNEEKYENKIKLVLQFSIILFFILPI